MTAPEPAAAAPDATPDVRPFDALLLVSFGGPEKPEDVVPFLENVTRGRGIPKERLEEVGEHYFLFGGRSPPSGRRSAIFSRPSCIRACHSCFIFSRSSGEAFSHFSRHRLPCRSLERALSTGPAPPVQVA